MLSPKEKAENLFVKFNEDGLHQISSIITRHIRKEIIKQCALIAVDEIMYNNLMEYPQHSTIYAPHKNDYWQEVKQEIEQL
jgi:hypothetical protein